jgi:hypothetical protein
MDSISEFLGQGADHKSISDRILSNFPTEPVQKEQVQEVQEPAPVKQPMLPDAPALNVPDEITDDTVYEEDIDDSLPEFEQMDVRGQWEIKAADEIKDRRSRTDAAIRSIAERSGGLTRNKGQANNLYLNMVKEHENPSMKGLSTVNGEKRFMMFESISEKKTPGLSKYEIGYGLKVKEDWLSDDPKKWLKIHDVPVDVRQGLTVKQVNTLLEERVGKDRAVTGAQLSKWADMTEEEKMCWQDLTYNGGIGLLKSNSEAKTAANKGYGMEGIVKLTHFTRAGSNRYRGLLKRRINMYNHAALSVPGAPVIEKYEYGPKGMRIKFSSKLMGDSFSPAFKKKVNDNAGWYNVPGKVKEGKDKLYSMNDKYQFEA